MPKTSLKLNTMDHKIRLFAFLGDIAKAICEDRGSTLKSIYDATDIQYIYKHMVQNEAYDDRTLHVDFYDPVTDFTAPYSALFWTGIKVILFSWWNI